MNKINKFILLVLVAGVTFSSCDGIEGSLVNAELEENPLPTPTEYSSGSANFSNYIAIGNSLTAGYMDGALYTNGQNNSLASIIASQLVSAGGASEFVQPNINSANGFNTGVSPNPAGSTIFGRFKLFVDSDLSDGDQSGPSVTVSGNVPAAYSGETLNNFGVPGIKVGDLLTPAAATNPFYARFASNPGVSTILGDALSSNPTFFSLWIGNNDVLKFATTGGEPQTTADELTIPGDFQADFSSVISQLLASDSNLKGVVGNIPNVLAAPFFQAIAYNRIELDAQTATLANGAFAGFNAALDGIVGNLGHDADDAARRKVEYSAGSNPILVIDNSLEDLGPKFDQLQGAGAITEDQRNALRPFQQARPLSGSTAVGKELPLLSAATVLGTLADPENPLSIIGVAVPMADRYALTVDEIIEIETARATFNIMIKAVVDNANAGGTRIALFDITDLESAFSDIFGFDGSAIGISVDGVNLGPDFRPTGVISTDGIHPNPRGNALIANDFIRSIEETFNAVIPKASVLNYPSVTLCAIGDCAAEQ